MIILESNQKSNSYGVQRVNYDQMEHFRVEEQAQMTFCDLFQFLILETRLVQQMSHMRKAMRYIIYFLISL